MAPIRGRSATVYSILLLRHDSSVGERSKREPCVRVDSAKGKDAMSVIRQLSLVKGEERFIFRYQAGQETEVIDAFASMAADRANEFDWFDAAVLSYQMGRRLETELEQLAAPSKKHDA